MNRTALFLAAGCAALFVTTGYWPFLGGVGVAAVLAVHPAMGIPGARR